MIFYSSPPVDGTLRRYHAHPEAWLHRLPDNISCEEGALLEPLSVALAGIERSGLRLGDPLVIGGAGPIGMVTLLAANASGASPIVITDLDENRLKMAQNLVPRVRILQIQRGQDPKDIATSIKEKLGQEAKLVMECTGVESSIHAGIFVSLLCQTYLAEADCKLRLLASAVPSSSLVSEVPTTSNIRSCMPPSERLTSDFNFATTRHIRRLYSWYRRA